MRSNDLILKSVAKEEDFSFSKHTTYGLGGKVREAYFPKNEEEAIAVFSFLKENNQKFIVLGNGSNVLASDKFFDGAVICTKLLQGIKIEDGVLKISSGTTVSSLLKFCVKYGIGGFEYLAGIPATVGGLAIMDGGIREKHIEQNIVSVRIFDGKIRNLCNKDCNFGNKHSTMRDAHNIILSVSAKIERLSPQQVSENIRYYVSHRSKLPKGKSCGCVFKNPVGQSAGKIIDEAGLKGLKIGGAEVSSKHANFIINKGATTSDVYALIKLVKTKVYEKTGVLLDEEVVYIGEFNDFDS